MPISRQLISGVITIGDDQTYADAILADDATFDLSAQRVLILTGDDALDRVTVEGAGQLRALAPLALDDGLTLQGAALVNAAEATQNGYELTLDDSATLRNLPAATWTLAQGAGIAGAADSRFVNFGLLQQTGAADTSTIAAPVYDFGTLDVEGTLTFTGAVTRLFGAVKGAGAIAAEDPTLIGASISSASFSATRARLLGDVQFATASATIGALVLAGATLAFHGDDSTLTVSAILGSGEIDFSGATKLAASKLHVDPNIVVVNSGVLTVTGASAETIVRFEANAKNLAGATWINAESYTYYGGVQNGGGPTSFDNAGTYIEDGQGYFYNVNNDGVMTLGPSYSTNFIPSTLYPNLSLGGLITGTGTIEIGPGIVGVDAVVDAGQTFAFTQSGVPGSQPGLVLQNAPSFGGAVSGFATGDKIELHSEVAMTFVGFTMNADGKGGVLAFDDGGVPVDIHMTGAYDAAAFGLSSFFDDETITYAGHPNGLQEIDDRVLHSGAFTDASVLFALNPGASLVLAGDAVLGDDVLSLSGQVRSLGGLQIDDGLSVIDQSSLVNAGTATVNGGVIYLGHADTDSASLRNLAGAVFTLANGAGVFTLGSMPKVFPPAGPASTGSDWRTIYPPTASLFVNLGLLQQSGASNASVIDIPFLSRGTVDVEGVLTFDSAAMPRFFGALQGAGQITADDATFIGTDISCGSLTVTGKARLLGDVTISSATIDISKLALANATLTLTGDDSILNLGAVRGSGKIVNQGSLSIGSFYLAGPVGISLVNAGVLSTSQFSGPDDVSNLAGAVWNDSGSGYRGSSGALFHNSGSFYESGFGAFDLAVENDGVMALRAPEASATLPSFSFYAPLTGTGAIDIGAGGVGVFAAVSAGQTLTFEPTGPEPGAGLLISDVQDFAATVAGFGQQGATSDTLEVHESGWAYQDFVASAGGGALIFSNGGAQAQINLAGQFDPTKFHIAAPASGDTVITYG